MLRPTALTSEGLPELGHLSSRHRPLRPCRVTLASQVKYGVSRRRATSLRGLCGPASRCRYRVLPVAGTAASDAFKDGTDGPRPAPVSANAITADSRFRGRGTIAVTVPVLLASV